MNEQTKHIGDAAEKVAKEWAEDRQQAPRNRLQLGWPGIDKSLKGGLQPGAITLLASPEKVRDFETGLNTRFAINCALQVAVEQKRSTVYVTNQLSIEKVARRLLASIARIPRRSRENESYTNDELTRLSDAVQLLKISPLHMLDICGLPFEGVLSLVSSCKDWCPEAANADVPALVIIDSFDDLFFGEQRSGHRLHGLPQEEARVFVMLEKLLDIANFMDASMLILAGLRDVDGPLDEEIEVIHNLPCFRQMARCVHTFMVVTPGGACPHHSEANEYGISISTGRYSVAQGCSWHLLKLDEDAGRFREPDFRND